MPLVRSTLESTPLQPTPQPSPQQRLEANPPEACNTGPASKPRRFASLRASARRIRQRPLILLPSSIVAAASVGVLVLLALLLARHRHASDVDDIQRQATNAARYIEQILARLLAPAQSFSVIVFEDPSWDSLRHRVPLLAAEILSKRAYGDVRAREISKLQVAPDGVVEAVYPPPEDGTPGAVGLDLFEHPDADSRKASDRARDSRKFTFAGPFEEFGRKIVSFRYPVFVPVSRGGFVLSEDGTAASVTGRRFTELRFGTKDGVAEAFWGFTNVKVDVENFVDIVISQKKTVDRNRYRYHVFVPGKKTLAGNEGGVGVGDDDVDIYRTEPGPLYDAQRARIELLQKTWMVELGLKDPPGTAWIAVMMAGGVAIGLMAGALTLLASLANAKHMELLVAILPKHVIEAVHRNAVVAESVPRVITLFTDMVDSTRISTCVEPAELLETLSRIFARFDDLCAKHGAFSLDIIGDAYIAVSGIEPLDDGPSRGGRGAGAEKRGVDGAAAMMAQLALDMVDAVRDERWGGEPVRLRVGLHVGPVVAGVVGSAKPKYTVVGETMNIGSRMESTGEPMRVQVTEAFRDRLEESGAEYVTEPRMVGEQHGVFVKGKGVMRTWWLNHAMTALAGPSDVTQLNRSASTEPA